MREFQIELDPPPPEGLFSDIELLEMSRILAPVVNPDACVGCGICQHLCYTTNVKQQAKLEGSAIGALAVMLWEPHIEGRNAHATLFEIYCKDPFLAYAYIASIPFFVTLYQVFKVLGYGGQNKFFSQAAVKAMRTMRNCAIALIGFVAIGEIYIVFGNSDDRPGGVFMGILIAFGSSVIATAAAMFERILQRAVDMKSENDVTV